MRQGALEATHLGSEGNRVGDTSHAAAVSGAASPQPSRRASIDECWQPTSRASVTRAGSVAGSVVAAGRAIKCDASKLSL